MSVLFTDTMTVYNYHRDPDTEEETWLRSVVRGVQWSHNKRELTVSDGVQTETKVESITVDFQRSHGNKPYLPPPEFARLTRDEAGNYWTLDPRAGQDIAVLGEAGQEISKSYRLSELREDYQYAVKITAVSDNRNRPRLRTIKAVGLRAL